MRRREDGVADDAFSDLVAAVAERRDKTAFTQLFDHFAPRVKAYLLRLGTDSGAAEELTQEVMVTLWRKAALFDHSKSSVGTWLFRIARNRRIDQIRRSRGETLDEDDPMLLPASLDGPDEIFDARRLEVRMQAALDGLPDEQAQLVRLAFFDSLSHSEIAERTGLPLGTVKSRIRLAFARLRRNFEDRGGV
jgi:RNA polymerase sigma factor (sigma-70 family)